VMMSALQEHGIQNTVFTRQQFQGGKDLRVCAQTSAGATNDRCAQHRGGHVSLVEPTGMGDPRYRAQRGTNQAGLSIQLTRGGLGEGRRRYERGERGGFDSLSSHFDRDTSPVSDREEYRRQGRRRRGTCCGMRTR